MSHRNRTLLTLTLMSSLLLGQLPAALAAPALASSRIVGLVLARDMVAPASDLTVQAFPDGAKAPVASTATDDKGRFSLEGLPAGSYILLLSNREGPVAAARIATRAGQKETVTLALPDHRPGEGTLAPAAMGGFAAWIATPLGATISAVGVAVVLAAGAHQITKNDNSGQEQPVSPSGR
jgi:hypothetical protein